MADVEAAKTIQGTLRRRMLGLARRVSLTAKVMAVGSVAVLGTSFVTFPRDVPIALTFIVLGCMGALLLSPLVGLAGMALRFGGFRRQGTLSRDARGLLFTKVGGPMRVLGAGIVSGIVAPKDAGFEVHLELSNGNELSILVADEPTAERLLDLADVSHERRKMRVRWGNLLGRIGAGFLGASVTVIAGLALMVSVSSAWGAAVLMGTAVAPFIVAGALSDLLAWREIEVGADGIAWRFFWRRKLVPLRDVRRVETRGDQLVVVLNDGSERCFVVSRAGFAEGLCHRIDAALSATGRAEGKAPFFARGELTFVEWTRRMRGLFARATSFRDLPVDVADAVRVLEDANAEPGLRLGAALALQETGESALADKVRLVAERCVSPKFRVALESAAEGELQEEVLEAAREELQLAKRAPD